MVDGSGLENRQGASPRGFESHPLRPFSSTIDGKTALVLAHLNVGDSNAVRLAGRVTRQGYNPAFAGSFSRAKAKRWIIHAWQPPSDDVTLPSREKRSFRLRQLWNAEAAVEFPTALVRGMQDLEPGRAAAGSR